MVKTTCKKLIRFLRTMPAQLSEFEGLLENRQLPQAWEKYREIREMIEKIYDLDYFLTEERVRWEKYQKISEIEIQPQSAPVEELHRMPGTENFVGFRNLGLTRSIEIYDKDGAVISSTETIQPIFRIEPMGDGEHIVMATEYKIFICSYSKVYQNLTEKQSFFDPLTFQGEKIGEIHVRGSEIYVLSSQVNNGTQLGTHINVFDLTGNHIRSLPDPPTHVTNADFMILKDGVVGVNKLFLGEKAFTKIIVDGDIEGKYTFEKYYSSIFLTPNEKFAFCLDDAGKFRELDIVNLETGDVVNQIRDIPGKVIEGFKKDTFILNNDFSFYLFTPHSRGGTLTKYGIK